MGKDTSDFVKIGGSLGGILLVIIIVFLIFAKDLIVTVMSTIVCGFVVLGVFLGFFAYMAQRKK